MFANPNLVSSVEGVHSCGDACIGVSLGQLDLADGDGRQVAVRAQLEGDGAGRGGALGDGKDQHAAIKAARIVAV